MKKQLTVIITICVMFMLNGCNKNEPQQGTADTIADSFPIVSKSNYEKCINELEKYDVRQIDQTVIPLNEKDGTYTQSLDEITFIHYRYVGELDNMKPTGLGILYEINSTEIGSFSKTDIFNKKIVYVPVYVGYFKDGMKDGYGVELYSDWYACSVIFEGNYKKGKAEGKVGLITYGTNMPSLDNRLFDSDYTATGDFEKFLRTKSEDSKLTMEDLKESYGTDRIRYFETVYQKVAEDEKKLEQFGSSQSLSAPTVLESELDNYFIGQFAANLPESGTWFIEGAKFYEGEIGTKGALPKPHGEGKTYYPSGKLMYDGKFKDGKFDGNGKLYYESGTLKYSGGFKNSVYHGKGTLYNEDGTQMGSGTWKNGMFQ